MSDGVLSSLAAVLDGVAPPSWQIVFNEASGTLRCSVPRGNQSNPGASFTAMLVVTRDGAKYQREVLGVPWGMAEMDEVVSAIETLKEMIPHVDSWIADHQYAPPKKRAATTRKKKFDAPTLI